MLELGTQRKRNEINWLKLLKAATVTTHTLREGYETKQIIFPELEDYVL